ncbi:hypothetical protein MELA_01682 [Candidatus Methylomirabilis lanthanidiphila]|uniref:Uncharacterized protein n=1 Tax=Candidatus Methylomirabilis lanthanidiphila TaxID=2211376 RepID=A0A564ZIY6_9BACT|nr:hypothetical protein MELA_01682 [Candidatus Methylomirabilis lanthanidiphila]
MLGTTTFMLIDAPQAHGVYRFLLNDNR